MDPPQVYLNFRGAELRQSFISHLEMALRRSGVKVYVDHVEFKDELVKIKELVDEGKLIAIPIYYKLSPSQVKNLGGDFGINLLNLATNGREFNKLEKWTEALGFFSQRLGLVYDDDGKCNEGEFISEVILSLNRLLSKFDYTPMLQDDNVENNEVDPIKEEKKEESGHESSNMVEHDKPSPKQKVYISFRGSDTRTSFVSHLVKALEIKGVDVYNDRDLVRGADLRTLFMRIKESMIALVIFSTRYTESLWCLEELVKIQETAEKCNLVVIPIFYKVKPSDVRYLKGDFGTNFWNLMRTNRDHNVVKWKEALESIASRIGFCLNNHSSENEFVTRIANRVVDTISRHEGEIPTPCPSTAKGKSTELPTLNGDYVGMEQRMEQLEKKLEFDCNDTRIIGVVGMPGIGKTTLAMKLHEKWNRKFVCCLPLYGIRKKSEKYETLWLRKTLLEILLEGKFPVSDDTTHESVKEKLLKTKFFAVLDDVSDKKQLEFLLGDRNWIKKGSKIIVITTRDKSWIGKVVDDTYVVPRLNEYLALQLFRHHAFKNQEQTHNFVSLSKKFVDYAGGNPLALEELGKELCNKTEAEWETRLETMPHCCIENIKRKLKISYDTLTDQQKDAFLDIACFFISEEEDKVTSLLASLDSHEFGEGAREVRDLIDKFMISVSTGRIEMSGILSSLGKELGLIASLEDNMGKSRLCDHDNVVRALLTNEETDTTVRGMLLDVSKLKEEIAIATNKLALMPNLRYIKIFDSSCPRQCKAVDVVGCKVHLPDELELPLTNIRYLHWLKYPSKQLPSDFKPENLIDLRLPYSKIERIWEVVTDAPNLKWVDLSHSKELTDLSALWKAESLERLNLEGCTELVSLPEDTENIKSLSFLNLRGCKSLESLPEMENLIFLKTLILSDCSRFHDFRVKSKNLEHLHLDGTEIKKLPETINNLQRLAVLNLEDCKMLESLPSCLDELKALEELILSGCSKLKSFPEIKGNMENLQILLLDRTIIRDVPNILSRCTAYSDQMNIQQLPRASGLSLLRRLCLSRNNMIIMLQSSISDLYHLKWIDLKYCKNLVSISTLPPNLQCLDAPACTSLKTVSSPLALLSPTETVPSSFIFTNCEKLEHVAKNEITSYGHNKSRLLSETLNRHNKGLTFEALVATCFPGSEVPAWFGYKAYGAVLEPELPRHWNESGFVGIALCAIVFFQKQRIQNNNLQVKCICDFNNVKTSSSYFNCPVGGLSETDNEQRTIKSTHVFIGYTNWVNIKKCQEEVEEEGEEGEEVCKKGCVPTKASIKFQVTDDIGEVKNCEVLECGFSLVYETGSWEADSMANDVEQEGGIASLGTSKKVSKTINANCGATTMRSNKVTNEASCSSPTKS
ncbi:unnamed protein product [Cochlearia groenlandica]